MENYKNYIKLLRPHHYIKNLLIFLPLIFSNNVFNIPLLKNTIVGWISFCLIASTIYIFNDIIDVDIDRQSNKNSNRPIASGKISVNHALFLAFLLLAIYIFISILFKASYKEYLLIGTYFTLNILYSARLKQVPILDIVILASGFILRVFYGSIITHIELSNWLYITILSFSFYMGLGKRRNELNKSGNTGRKVLEYYSKSFLNNNMYICMTLGIVFYSLWCMDIGKVLSSKINTVWTIPLVLIICMKYSLNIEGDSYGDPVDVLLHDKALICLTIFYAILMFLILYI